MFTIHKTHFTQKIHITNREINESLIPSKLLKVFMNSGNLVLKIMNSINLAFFLLMPLKFLE